MTESREIPLPGRHVIDPVAFFVALVGGPILFTLGSFWLLFIPVFALLLGAIPYLVIGTPVLLIHLARHPVRPGEIAALAFWIVFCLWVGLIVGGFLAGMGGTIGVTLFFGGFAAIFAPIWGACFGWLYLRLARDFYTQPVLN